MLAAWIDRVNNFLFYWACCEGGKRQGRPDSEARERFVCDDPVWSSIVLLLCVRFLLLPVVIVTCLVRASCQKVAAGFLGPHSSVLGGLEQAVVVYRSARATLYSR